MAEFDTDVFVVGMGPTGLTAALALTTYGINVQVITRYDGLSNSPRAHITNQRAMEVFRDLGIEGDVLEEGSGWSLMGDTLFATSLAGREIARLRTWGTGDDEHGRYVVASPCGMLDIPQPKLEAVLLRNAAERGADTRFNTDYLGHVQDADGVTVRVRDRVSGVESDVRARYLVGADGARSQIADEIGLPFRGEMGRATTAYVRFRADLSMYVAHRPSILYWIVSATSGFGEIGMGLLRTVHPWDEWITGWGVDPSQGEPNFSTASLVARIRTLVGDPDLQPEIVDTSTWQVNDAFAEIYHAGRVFVGGDAVHRHPPSGGLGSNTSVQDAFNLAWKLAFVIQGWAGPGLLESYSAERVPVGEQVVGRANRSRVEFAALKDVLGVGSGSDLAAVLKTLDGSGPEGAIARDSLTPALHLKNYEFNAHGVEMNQRYESSAALVTDDGHASWRDDPELVAQPSTGAGAKLPHAWLVGADGIRLSTLDVVGRGGLALLTGLSGVAWSDAVGRIGFSYLSCTVVGEPQHADLYRSWHGQRDMHDGGALLVRPDGYIAWRHREPVWDTDEAERLLRDVLGRVLSLDVGAP
ncbi:FAD-dependent monooxygenase [soil metagenome]